MASPRLDGAAMVSRVYERPTDVQLTAILIPPITPIERNDSRVDWGTRKSYTSSRLSGLPSEFRRQENHNTGTEYVGESTMEKSTSRASRSLCSDSSCKRIRRKGTSIATRKLETATYHSSNCSHQDLPIILFLNHFHIPIHFLPL